MKKLSILLLVAMTACRSQNSHDGTYVSRSEGVYSIADDTLIIQDGIVTKRIGCQKIKKRQLRQKLIKSAGGI